MLGRRVRKTPIALAVSAALFQGPVLAYEVTHIFSVDDVMGGFTGTTFGTGGAAQDTSIICGISGGATCGDITPYPDKSGVTMYPVDSEFGFYVVDFLGAQGKARDYDYAEGFVGSEPDGGIRVANAPTLKYKVKPPLGTWCQGLGGTSVKCETEHYTTMEHVLSCYETIPYQFANPVTGEQDVLSTPDGSLTFDCLNAPLDDNVIVLVNGLPSTRLTDATPCETAGNPAGCQMFPNDKTDMQNNIALSTDYSVQLKDDGKPLYGWGGVHKRPNDIRLYASLDLPGEWKDPGADFVVTKAQLVIDHLITNNPNDQVRPEDLENEAATGRKPSYRVEGTPGTSTEVWKSTIDCYEGDGDFIEGETGATPIGEGTVLKNAPFALDPAATPGVLPADDPYAFSSDLYGAFTNGFYTTINRDPFQWSYLRKDRVATDYSFIGCNGPAEGSPDVDPLLCVDDEGKVYADVENLELVSGPRWRLKPNKFGQDLPGLEIPLIECSQPPFKSDNTKYAVGTRVTTVINLLDWDDSEGPSPLASSKGWVDIDQNEFVTKAGENNGVAYTTNGLPLTDDFDIAFYVKGDSKSTAIYSAKLVLEYEGETTPPVTDSDLALKSISVPPTASTNSVNTVSVTVSNTGLLASGTVTLDGVSSRGNYSFTAPIVNLGDGAEVTPTWSWTAPSRNTRVTWTATVSSSQDDNPANDTATASTRVAR